MSSVHEEKKESLGRNGEKAKKSGELREKESDATRSSMEENDGRGNKERKMGTSEQNISIDEFSRRRRLKTFDIINKRFIS
jgi:hypothetical protein